MAGKNESFIRELWLQYGDKNPLINMEQLSTSNDNFVVSKTDNQAFLVDYDCHESTNIRVNITDDLYLVISKFNNPQVRTGFSLKGGVHQLKNTSGALCNRLYKEDMMLDEIINVVPIKQLEDRKPKGKSNELYYNSDGQKVSKTISLY